MKKVHRLLTSLAVVFTCCNLAIPAAAATPSSGTVSPTVTTATWQGQTYAVGAAVAASQVDPAACPPSSVDFMNQVCDHFFVRVDVPASYWDNNTGGGVVIGISWGSVANDFDMFVFDAAGNQVGTSASGNTTSERVFINRASGTYEVLVVPFSVTNSGYGGTAGFTAQNGFTTSPNWSIQTHGECCEGNLASQGPTSYMLLPVLIQGNKIKRTNDGGKTWEKVYPPADVSVPFGIEGDLRAYGDDAVFFGTELTHGVAAVSNNRGDSWTTVQIPVAFVGNDQAWLYMGPGIEACPVQTKPYVLTGWYRIGSVALFSCDGGLTWPIQTPLVGLNGSGPQHVMCTENARNPVSRGDTRIAHADFARMKAGRHGGWGTDGKFYWSQATSDSLYVCKTGDFGVTWDGVRHTLAPGTPEGQIVTAFAFDENGTLYVLHANKLYVSFDQGESFRYVHTLPRWGNDSSVGDNGAAQYFVVNNGTIHIGLKEASSGGPFAIWYLQGKRVDTASPTWKQEQVDAVGSERLDFMQITMDGNGVLTISYTTPPNFDNGVTTASRKPVQ